MKILKEVIRKNIRVMAVFAVMVAANATIFALYDIITEPMIYAVILTFVVMAVIFAIEGKLIVMKGGNCVPDDSLYDVVLGTDEDDYIAAVGCVYGDIGV